MTEEIKEEIKEEKAVEVYYKISASQARTVFDGLKGFSPSMPIDMIHDAQFRAALSIMQNLEKIEG